MKQLTPKEARFVQEYLVDLSAAQAAIRAGYSEHSARNCGYDVLHRPHVEAAIQEAMAARAKRTEISQDTVLRELLAIARSDIGELFDADGKLRPLAEIPEQARRAIAAIETETRKDVLDETAGEAEEVTTKKVKLWDKPKALELLGKHLKLWVDRIEVDATDKLAERLAKAVHRVKGSP